MFWFNREVLDRFLLKPAATAWDFLLPDPVQRGIYNIFDNLAVVRRVVNNTLQAKFSGAGTELARFTINSTIGLVGFFDDGKGHDGPLTGVLPYIGTLDAVAAFSENYEELDVFLAVPWTAGARILEFVEQLRFMPATIRLIPDLPAFAALSGSAAAAAAKLTPILHTPPLPP